MSALKGVNAQAHAHEEASGTRPLPRDREAVRRLRRRKERPAALPPSKGALANHYTA
ncbi:hypothetical protein GCM10009544_30130 [Streptomyces stramineus]|uniref:Uncharacterized protein n=1 Tax=Streptomyces stramineus TaxID=173861 RepID=A0ABN1A279_9ACTN